MSGALEGVRVIDFGQYLAGPLAAMLLADNGAEVIRVDPLGGPHWRHPANAVLQRGKYSIVLDLKQPADLAVAQRLVASADVVIENFRPGVMERLGVGPHAMTSANPALIYCSLPGFGEDDPRAGLPGWEGVITAASGLYYPPLPAAADGPVYSAVPLASSYAAFIAGHSIVAALIARRRTGRGQRIEAPLFDAAHQAIGGDSLQVNGGPPPREMPMTNRAVIKRHLCADGRYVDVSPPLRGWAWFAQRFLPKELNERGITDIYNTDPAEGSELRDVLVALFKTRTAAEWETIVNEEAGTGMAFCQTTAEWLHDEHARGSRCAIAIEDPEYGPTWQAGYPVTLNRTPSQAQGPRHALDSDRQSVLTGLEAPRLQDSADAASTETGLRGALAGFRAVDISQVLAGPTACRILAEYGAEIIKINNPRRDNPQGARHHIYVNNGKRTMLLDLKSADGRMILQRLVEKADVFHQNFARGVAERLGIGESDIRAVQPNIVYSSINTHADGGFRSLWRGHEELGQAVTGMQVRYGGDDEPARTGWAVCDYSTGHLSAFGILLALYHRLRTGEGQHVQASLSQSATFLQVPFMIDYAGHEPDEPRGLDAKGRGPLNRLYRAGDRWLFLAAPRPGELKRLATIDGLADIDALPPEQLEAALEVRFAADTAEAWVARLTGAGLSAQVVRKVAENMLDPVAQQRGLSVRREHAGVGEVRGVGLATRFSLTPPDPLFGVPPPGSDTRRIVEEIGLGDRFESLAANGVVAEEILAPA